MLNINYVHVDEGVPFPCSVLGFVERSFQFSKFPLERFMTNFVNFFVLGRPFEKPFDMWLDLNIPHN